MIYLIDNHVVFKRGRETLRGKILAIERYGEQASRSIAVKSSWKRPCVI